MKRVIYIFPVFVLLSMISCKEDTLETYHGDNYIHFTPSVTDSPEVFYNFAYDSKTTREISATVPVEIRLWGYLPTEAFNCIVSVDKENTTAADTDYADLQNPVFRAGHHVDTLWVNVNRKTQLLETDYVLRVNLDGAEDGFVAAPAKYCHVDIRVTDKITDMPKWWGTTQVLGEWSPIKYRLLNIYLGKVLVDLNEYTNITLKEEALKFKVWLKSRWDDGTYRYYASDGNTPLYETIPE